MKRTVDQFLQDFVRPLVGGGELVVGVPVDSEEIVVYERDLDSSSTGLVAVDDARARVASTLVVRPPTLVMGSDDLYLACAVHNLLFLQHPRADSWAISSKAEDRVVDTATYFASRPLARNRREALARHALLHNLFDVTRSDIRVSWWTGSATFRGQTPPTRLRSFRTLRRVREETTIAGYAELLGSDDARPVVNAILRRSPLTQLLLATADGPPLTWEDVVFVLRDAELARAVAYRAVEGAAGMERGEEYSRELLELPARYALAYEQMLERSPAEADVRAVTAFLVYLNVLLALAEIRAVQRGAPALLPALLAPERAGNRFRGVGTLLALPAAVGRVDPRLAAVPGLGDDPDLSRTWSRHRDQVAEAFGDGTIDGLAAKLSRRLTAVLESGLPNHGEPTHRESGV